MSDDAPADSAPREIPPSWPRVEASPETMAAMFGTPLPSRGWSMRGKLLGALLVAGIGLGASVMSCVGQSFSLRQARALEGIQEELRLLRASCVAVPREVAR